MKFRGGFSLIEVLIAVFLLGAIAVLSVGIFRTVTRHTALREAANLTIETIRTARERTLAAVNDQQHGVHLDTNAITLFEGPTYVQGAASNEVKTLPPGIDVATIAIAGGSDILFDRVTGTTANTGTFLVRLADETGTAETVQVHASGQVGTLSTVPPESDRLVDDRHLHFDLGWSILGATTMTVTFHNQPAADVSYDIDMVEYFTVSPDAFSWSASLDAYSATHTLAVSTVSLDAGNTILDIHRDGRLNSAAVTIAIDGKEIVSYDASGNATVGIFGGTMTTQ